MGMSASQARLLSLTTRLTNNEFRAQTITNSKLRLADKSTEASQEYMGALNSQKMVYNFYNDKGEFSQQNMTAGLVYTYSPLKNQYALINPSGKILVSSEDSKNFENSKDLKEFLECYDLFEESSNYGKYQEDLQKYQAEKNKYDGEKAKYDEEKAKYDAEKKAYDDAKKAHMDKYNDEMRAYREKMIQYQIDYQGWLNAKDSTDLYDTFSGIVGTSDAPTAFCYTQALNGDAGCYLHLLNHIIDYNGSSVEWAGKSYTTSAGKDLVPGNSSTGGMGTAPEMKEVSDALNENNPDGTPSRICDGDDDLNTPGKQNILQMAKAEGRQPTELEILKSDYIEKADGTFALKSLKQKAIDMYYIIQNLSGQVNADDMKNMLINFTDGDMKKLSLPEPPEPEAPTPPDIPPFEGEPPKEPPAPKEPQKPTYELTLKDKDKSQWYVNLWHMMNGSETANLVKALSEQYGEIASSNFSEETIFVVANADKNALKANYEVFDDNLLNNSSWLQFALEHGAVSISQAQYSDPTEDSKKTPELLAQGVTWKSIVHTSATDFSFVDDEVAIAKAEVKYKNALNEIEYKDKKYDQDLKKLDTEHNALETEYESLKSVISKNVERSFKAFS